MVGESGSAARCKAPLTATFAIFTCLRNCNKKSTRRPLHAAPCSPPPCLHPPARHPCLQRPACSPLPAPPCSPPPTCDFLPANPYLLPAHSPSPTPICSPYLHNLLSNPYLQDCVKRSTRRPLPAIPYLLTPTCTCFSAQPLRAPFPFPIHTKFLFPLLPGEWRQKSARRPIPPTCTTILPAQIPLPPLPATAYPHNKLLFPPTCRMASKGARGAPLKLKPNMASTMTSNEWFRVGCVGTGGTGNKGRRAGTG